MSVISPTDDCPTLSQLQRFLDAELADETSALIDTHVHGCVQCRSRLNELIGSVPTALGQVEEGDENPPCITGYEVIDKLAVGGMGVVWQVQDLRTNRLLAIKTMRSRDCHDEQLVCRFQSEAQLIGQLTHPYIVPVHSTGEPTTVAPLRDETGAGEDVR